MKQQEGHLAANAQDLDCNNATLFKPEIQIPASTGMTIFLSVL